MFTYPEGNTALDFAFPDHIPQFLDEVVATASVNVLTACGDSVQCIFDASQTGDISIGLETMIINVANVDYRQEASTLMRICEQLYNHTCSELSRGRIVKCLLCRT